MVWNFRPKLRAYQYLGHKGPVYDVCFSPAGDLLASASQDRSVRLWTPTVRGDSVVIKGHAGGVRSVCFSYSAKQLLTASDDMSIKIWSLPNRRFMCSLIGHSNWVRSAQFSPDAHMIASASDDKTVRLWDVEKRQCLHTFYEHAGIVNCVQFHPEGQWVASCSADRSINIWDTRAHKLIHHYRAHDSNVTSLAFHPSGTYLVSTSTDHSIKLWDVREGQLLYTIHGHDGAVNCANFSHDCKYIASGSVDTTLMVWNADIEKCLQLERTSDVSTTKNAKRHNSVPTHIASVPPTRNVKISQFKEDSMIRESDRRKSTETSSHCRNSPMAQTRLIQNGEIYDEPPNTSHAEADLLVPPQNLTQMSLSENGVQDRPLESEFPSAFHHILDQLEIITRTLSVLEERISLSENRIAEVAHMQAQLMKQNDKRGFQGSIVEATHQEEMHDSN
ncbi:hypothetical protein ABG067_006126 [Albugo candida]